MGREVIYEIRKYNCGYCGKSFEEATRTTGVDKKGRVSNQVRCPKCRNFLPNKEGELLRTQKVTTKR